MGDYAKTGGKEGLPGYRSSSAFRAKVFRVVRGVAKGKTMTYAEVARRAGHPGAARAVGSALKTNFNPGTPCHRVVLSNGKIGQYNRGVIQKEKMLKKEGIKIINGKIIH